MDQQLFENVEAFIDRHSGLDGPDAREAIRAIAQGETRHLPEAATIDGQAIRSALLAALGAAVVPVAATPFQPTPPTSGSGMCAESRRVAFRAVAGPSLLAMADALAASALPDEQAMRAIETARQNLPAASFPAGYLTIEQRAAGQPEMGATFEMPMGGGDKEQAARTGWAKAFAKTERSAG